MRRFCCAAAGFGGMVWGLRKFEEKLVAEEFVPPKRPDLPVLTLDQIRQHTTEGSCWITYKGAVYEAEPFAEGHPGNSSRINMMCGMDLEPYWQLYRFHLRGHIYGLLEKYRVGTLAPEDAQKATDFEIPNIYDNDPARSNLLSIPMHFPFCAETRLDMLTKSYLTPNELFFTRCHAMVPDIKEDEHTLTIHIPGCESRTFTMTELKSLFPKHEVVSVMQCAGNRNEDFHGVNNGPTKWMYMGPHWSAGAIGCAKWGGVLMRDVLKYCGLDVDTLYLTSSYDPQKTDVNFEGIDVGETGTPFPSDEGTVPFDKIIDPQGDCLLAYEMNEKPLPRDHGFPLRAIIPGHTASRQTKWITEIRVQDHPAPAELCLTFGPHVSYESHLSRDGPQQLKENPKDEGIVVQELPLQSLMCEPPQNSIIGVKDTDIIEVKGIAWTGGGRGIPRVDVSMDEGKTWEQCELFKPVVQRRRGQWGWTQFSQKMKIPVEIKEKLRANQKVPLLLVSKAFDDAFNVQPDEEQPNARGVCIGHRYKVAVTLDPSKPAGYVFNPGELLTAEGKFANTPSGGKFRTPYLEAGWAIEGGVKRTARLENLKIDWKYYQKLQSPPYYAPPKYPTSSKQASSVSK